MNPIVVHNKKEPYDIYIGRPSKWGNPFSHLDNTLAEFKVNTREEAIKKYEQWIKTQPELLQSIHELKGKILGCWCKPNDCHGDILLKLANVESMIHNFQIANTDTDSISFCKSDGSYIPLEERKALVKEINELSPEFMLWDDDGYYKKVIILKAKNYILQKEDGKITYKGSSIKDQKKEPALRLFINDIIAEILNETFDYLKVYNKYVDEIFNITDIKPWCSKKTLTSKVLEGTRTNETKVMDAIEDTEYVEGDKLHVYFKNDNSLSLLENFDGKDYSKTKLLSKLHKTVKIFANVIDITQFPNYSLKKYKEILNEAQ